MLDLLGDMTSTVSFCQLSGGVCYLATCLHNSHALYRLICTCNSVRLLHFVSSLTDILPMSFCLHFMYKFHTPVESVY